MPADHEKIKSVAASILQIARNTLIVNLRFMDKAISMLACREADGLSGYAVDGKILYYDPLSVVKSFSREQNGVARAYLHLVMHCVFRHLWTGTLTDRKYWDLTCDIAVENAINDLDIPSVGTGRDGKQRDAVSRLSRKVKYITADGLYRYFTDARLKDDEIGRLAELFHVDIHDGWYPAKEGAGADAKRLPRAADGGEKYAGANGNGEEYTGAVGDEKERYEKMMSEWKSIASHMDMDLEMFARSKGDGSGGLFQNLKEVTREKYDYTAFLEKFSALGERMRLNDDEFDYILRGLGGTDFRPVFSYVDRLIASREFTNLKGVIYFTDGFGTFPAKKQRPIFLMGPPGIGKTAIMEQIASEMGVGMVSYTMTHHTRQSVLGLPFIAHKNGSVK